jgi:hypothetical protein
MMYTLDAKNANATSTHKTQFFEMMGQQALYHEGWFAVGPEHVVHLQVVRYWLKALCRRSQKHRLTWGVFGPRVNLLIPHPRVLHPHPNDRFYAKHPK